MTHPTVLDVPLGLMEGQPTLGEKERQGLLAANRLRFCGETREVSPPAGRRALEESGGAVVSKQEML
jgi:hypothetical protein